MSEMKDVRALIEQIDALLAINTSGNAVPRIPGLAVELLTRSRAALEPAPKPAGGEWVMVPMEPTPEMTSKGDCCLPQFSEEADGDDVANEVYRAMIAAAPPAPAASPSGGEVAVKALEWRRGYCDDQVIIEQASFGGLYQVRQFDGDIWLDHPSASSSKHETVGAAKAAAQADFEQRIRSALTSPEAPQSEVVRELVKALPRRHEKISGQTFSYVKLEDVVAILAKIGGEK